MGVQPVQLRKRPSRFASTDERRLRVPVHVVWELTLACDLRCQHCGSRAGRRRPNELSIAECLEVVDQLASMGTREISLIGGEAYLKRGLDELIRHIHSKGMYCAIQSGGLHFTDKRLARVVSAGLNGLGVSIDGLEPLHDFLRGVKGSFQAAMSTLRRARAAGLVTSVNSQIGAWTLPDLPGILDAIADAGATHWQVQLTVAMGNAVDNSEVLLQPHQLAALMPMLVELYQRGLERRVLLIPGNNIGYYGPFEHIWRQNGDETPYWTGCQGGETGLALEADGTIKGCPSVATARFAGGNVRDRSIADAWMTSDVLANMRAAQSELWGFCGTCYYRGVCAAGCTWTGDSLLGRAGNNPYCHHRVLELADLGFRERIEKVGEAGRTPFSTGQFRIVLEDRDGQVVPDDRAPRPARSRGSVGRLVVCGHCHRHVFEDEPQCAFCGTDLHQAAREEADRVRRRDEIVRLVEASLHRR